jgi:hypothetical protein
VKSALEIDMHDSENNEERHPMEELTYPDELEIIDGRWRLARNPETACSKHPMTNILVAEREDGLAIYSSGPTSQDRYWMRMRGDDRGMLVVVGCPPFGEVIAMADKQWPFEEQGSSDA